MSLVLRPFYFPLVPLVLAGSFVPAAGGLDRDSDDYTNNQQISAVRTLQGL